MKKRTIIIIIITLLLIGAVLMMQNSDSMDDKGLSEERSSAQTQSDPNTVSIKNFKFSAQNLAVKKGTTVTWKNTDTARHNINFSDSQLVDSELLDQNGTYSYTFDLIGEFEYSCTPHPFMKATITVTEA